MLCELTDRVGRAVARLSDIVEGGGSGTSTSHCCRTSLFSNQIWRNYRFYVGCALLRSKRAYRECPQAAVESGLWTERAPAAVASRARPVSSGASMNQRIR